MIQAEDPQLARAHALKESLRQVFKLRDAGLAEEYLDKWISRARRSRLPAFVELQRKIKRNRFFHYQHGKIRPKQCKDRGDEQQDKTDHKTRLWF